jgi:hypothetical protein
LGCRSASISLTFLSLLPRPWPASRPDVLTAWAFRPFRLLPGQLDVLAAAASAQRLLRVLARRLQGTRTRLIAGSMSGGA